MKSLIGSISLLMMLLVSSCVGTKEKKQFTYFNNLPNDSVVLIPSQERKSSMLLKTNDILKISVSTLTKEGNALFNTGIMDSNKEGAGSLQDEGYRIDEEGNINFPVFGKIKVEGKSLEDVTDLLTQKISVQFKTPIVNVKLVNAQVYVLGEVTQPGAINIPQSQTSILEAIGLAGDILPTGRKDNVMLIRKENGFKKIVRLNLNDIETMNSKYFYLQQGDMIVVDPTQQKERIVKGRANGMQWAGLGLSAVSVIASLSLFLKK